DFRLTLAPGFSRQLLTDPGNPDQALLSWTSGATVLPQLRAAFRHAVLGAVMGVQTRQLLDRMAQRRGLDAQRWQAVLNPDNWHIETHVGNGEPLPSSVQQNVP